jgi:hypothetical protein
MMIKLVVYFVKNYLAHILNQCVKSNENYIDIEIKHKRFFCGLSFPFFCSARDGSQGPEKGGHGGACL